MTEEKLQAVAEVASKVTYTGAGTAILFGLTVNEVVALIGLIMGVLGFVTNAYYKRRQMALLERLAQSNPNIDLVKAFEVINKSGD
jgi:uncharacterized membrane protein YGL010W